MSRLSLVVALASAALAVPAGAAAAPPVRVPSGSRDLGDVAPGAQLHATVALRPRRAAALAAFAAAVSDPHSPDYHHYLSVGQFAHRFGPTHAQLALVRARLRAGGLSVGATSPNGLSISVSGPAMSAETAFATPVDRYLERSGATVQAPTAQPRLAGTGNLIQGIIGLDSVAPTAAVQIRDARGARAHARARDHAKAKAGAAMCAGATADASANDGESPDQIAGHYGLANFRAAGDQGRGETIAVYELEPFSASDLAGYQACMGTHASVTVEAVDGGPGTGPGTGEAAADVEDVVGLAPQASVRVYEGPATGEGAYDTYSQIVADDSAQVVSTSWGLCEAEEGRTEILAESVLFQEAAAQGQSVIASSGDNGSDDCGNGSAAVDDPGSQPWVTSVGGTHMTTGVDTVWDDGAGAGGGGVSQIWARPAWQTAAQPQTQIACGAAGFACREVPDLSADADPATGYLIFYRGAWRTVGGTSVATPTIAALAVLADASPACGGTPLGLLDPALYADGSDFQDVTSGSNAFGGVAGYLAGPGYDMASGLGTPTAALGPALCGDAVTLTVPAAESWTTGHPVVAPISATSLKQATLTYSATGLPAGVTINPASGQLTGTPTAAGTFTVTVTALDADGATRSAAFPVSVARAAITAPPRTHHAHHTHVTHVSHHHLRRHAGRRHRSRRHAAVRRGHPTHRGPHRRR